MFMKLGKLCCLNPINCIINHVMLCYVKSCYNHVMYLIGLFVQSLQNILEQGKPMIIKRKLDGAVHEFSPDQEICNSM